VRILGIHVESRTDVAAFVALVLSVSSLAMQFWDHLVGSQLTLLGPRQVIFRVSTSADGIDFVDAVSRQTYVNDGAPGYSEVVLGEAAYVGIGSATFRLRTLNVVSPRRDGDQLELAQAEDFLPFLVDGRSLRSHYTRFVSEPKDTEDPYLTYERFVEAVGATKRIHYRVRYEGREGLSDPQHCEVDAADVLVHVDSKGWAALPCQRAAPGQRIA